MMHRRSTSSWSASSGSLVCRPRYRRKGLHAPVIRAVNAMGPVTTVTGVTVAQPTAARAALVVAAIAGMSRQQLAAASAAVEATAVAQRQQQAAAAQLGSRPAVSKDVWPTAAVRTAP